MKVVAAWAGGVVVGMAFAIVGRAERLFERVMREQMALHGIIWTDDAK